MSPAQRRVARILVDTPLSHLDRPFDYAIPDDLAEAVVPGCRVKVRFAGRLVDGYVLDLASDTEHEGRLAPIAKVVSSEPVLVPEVALLARQVADRYAGTVGDVLRLAIPPRHARAEAHPGGAEPPEPPAIGEASWHAYVHGAAFVRALAARESPRAVLNTLPRHEPERAVAEAVSATVRSGRTAVVCVPDVRDAARWDAVFTEALGPGVHVTLTAADKPAARYRNFLKASRGEVRVVLGTRGAAYAPLRDLGLVVVWDDGDDLHAEPRAPYPHTREVLLTRAVETGAGVLIAGHARTSEAQSLVEQGWCAEIVADQPARRREWPVVDVTDGTEHGAAPARLPAPVFEAVRRAEGPVLVQVPRRGYRTSLVCDSCRTPAQCPACAGPLVQHRADAPLVCRWCATTVAAWRCGECSGTRLRAPVVGQLRTAEEFAAAFPGREVVTSGGDTVLDHLDRDDAVLVLATPGAEPSVTGGYAVVVLLDTWLMLARDDVRVFEESHRRWFNALALAGYGARAVAVGDTGMLQGLVRADPAGVAARELADRAQTHLPPVGRLATVDGPEDVITGLAARTWPPFVDVLGPVPVEPGRDRLILRVPRREGLALARVLKAVAAERSAAKEPPVRIQIDPVAF
ncbi:putative primosomal protein N' [Aeromicrobium flavum]|uniref:Probable replication restart protein PriA n=1 Tax=Aeromicrobium flavum TaxID=416568 RepID=A0A512HRM2_9ACTN|nr:primosome assembly protein PriA [Aeromicrobium flavum]GEO88105.1 putative primosomal protein N' [Aeromicrobium flavum]